MAGTESRATRLNFGDFGLKSESCGWVTATQIEAARKAIVHHTKREGKLWMRIFPDKSFTKKPAGTRMGSGKGEVVGYVAVVKPGRIIFELGGLAPAAARLALLRASAKLAIRTRIISRG